MGSWRGRHGAADIPVCSLLRRLVTLISQQALLGASSQAFRKQAEGASQAARRYMEDNEALRKVKWGGGGFMWGAGGILGDILEIWGRGGGGGFKAVTAVLTPSVPSCSSCKRQERTRPPLAGPRMRA